ncbi:MAG: terminase TerL endonuclease subunit, partial [Bacteroidota bacterium]
VSSGEIVSCKQAKQAVARHLQLLQDAESKGYKWSENSARYALDLFALFKHTSGDYGGKPFGMLPWQAFVVASIFGWYKKNDDGEYRRLFRTAYVEVAKKNGKTELAAGIGLILAFFDNEYGAEVYSAANKYDQAYICWNSARVMAEFLRQDSPGFKSMVKIHGARNNSKILSPSQNAFFNPVGGDSKTLDGPRPHGAIIDEFHEAKDDSILRNLSSGMVNRSQPLLFIITTAGFNIQGPCYLYRKVVCDILSGAKFDDSTFGIVFTLDEDDDWEDESNWVKANPSIGITPTWEGLRTEYTKARNEGSTAEVNFKTKNLNIWTRVAKTWIQDYKWMAPAAHFTTDSLIGRTCYAGLDLAKTRDLTALALLFPPIEEDELFKALFWFWCPEENARTRAKEDGVPYLDWANEGLLSLTPGDVTDYDFIYTKILEIGESYDLRGISYDPWNATQLATQLEQAGAITKQFPQTTKYYNEPILWIERSIMQKVLNHGGNKIIRWMAGNVVLFVDSNGNIRFDKKKSQEKIDGMAAFAMSVGEYLDKRDADPYQNVDWSQLQWL